MSDSVTATPPAPTIHEAELASGPSEAVLWGAELDLADAVARRRAGLDVVVRGDNTNANRRLARSIESAVGPAKRGTLHGIGRPTRPAALSASDAAPGGTLLLRDGQAQGEEEAMRYFTPERYAALQDFTSDDAMNADAAWEKAVEQYNAYYRLVEASLPAEFRRLQDAYYLHDARVLYLGPQGNRFVIALRLDRRPSRCFS